MAEKVKRIRPAPGGWDSNNDPVPSIEDDELLIPARGIEPGLSEALAEHARNGERIEFTVWLHRDADVKNGDDLIVRGDRFAVRVIDWRSPRTRRGGRVAFATLGRG